MKEIKGENERYKEILREERGLLGLGDPEKLRKRNQREKKRKEKKRESKTQSKTTSL